MLPSEQISTKWAGEFRIRAKEPKPKPTIEDRVRKRYERVLELIKKNEAKLKRTRTSLKKLYKRKKYYEDKINSGVKSEPQKSIQQKVLDWVKEHNCEVEELGEGQIEIVAPDGQIFDEGCHSLICQGWREAWGRIKDTTLEKEREKRV